MKLLLSCCFTGCFYVDDQKGAVAGGVALWKMDLSVSKILATTVL